VEDIQLRGSFLKDFRKPKFLHGALSCIIWGLQGDMRWHCGDNFCVILRCLWGLNCKETLGFVFLGNRRSQTEKDLEKRRMGLFWRHFARCQYVEVEDTEIKTGKRCEADVPERLQIDRANAALGNLLP
jgi:hypothetical protein